MNDKLMGYFRRAVVERFASTSSPPLTPAPQVERFAGTLLFADMTGFTSLTEQFAERGLDGVEQLTLIINRYFERLIELITTHVTRIAAQCGLAIQSALHHYEVSSRTHLSLRIGVGAGDIFAVHIGGISERGEFFVTGPPIAQVATAQKQGKAGEVILSPEAWLLVMVKDVCHGEPRANGYMRLETVHLPLPKKPLKRPQLSPVMVPALRPYIPKAILSRLSAGQTKWLAELRRVTVLFINAPDLNYTRPLEEAQKAMVALQKLLYRYEGGITRLAADDKGTILPFYWLR